MDLELQDRTARSRHSRAPMNGQTCIECHKGIAHELPDEPDGFEATPVKDEPAVNEEKGTPAGNS
ncbi:MAG: NapC/NirT family cytochrome c, partial [Gammaproteobacteria bacterium]|nr:NapC/NirT family cytochrome c [Gammaproteobacteria bacterium]